MIWRDSPKKKNNFLTILAHAFVALRKKPLTVSLRTPRGFLFAFLAETVHLVDIFVQSHSSVSQDLALGSRPKLTSNFPDFEDRSERFQLLLFFASMALLQD
jgi:hypothetical protein